MLSIAKEVDEWQKLSRSVSPIDLSDEEALRSKSQGNFSSENNEQLKNFDNKLDDLNHEENADELLYKPVRRGVALSQEIHDQYLVCKICLEDFKNPKSLDCMHTFCEECIENHVMSESSYKKYSDYREFTCPLCRKRTQLPLGGVRKLPDCHLISGVMNLVARRRPLTPIASFLKCDACRSPISCFRTSSLSTATGESDSSKSRDAASSGAARCLDCCKVMCARCAAVHRSTLVTQSHSLYDPDVVADVLKDPNALACREHCNETVQYYCVDCERCVCLLCAFDEQAVEPHVTHELIDFNAAASRHQSALRQLCDGATAETAKLEGQLTDLTSCADHIDSIRRQIQLTAESFRRMIDADERTLLDRLDAMYGGGDPFVNGRAAAATLRECVSRLATVRRLAETVAERRGIEMLLLHEEVENRIRREQQLVRERLHRGGSSGSTSASGCGTETNEVATDIMKKRVEFVAGVVNLGRLNVTESATTTGSSGIGRNESTGCCPTCHRRAAVFRDHSTMTETASTTSKQDKAINTRARGLLHSGGSGNSSGIRSGRRSMSLSSQESGTAEENQGKIDE